MKTLLGYINSIYFVWIAPFKFILRLNLYYIHISLSLYIYI